MIRRFAMPFAAFGDSGHRSGNDADRPARPSAAAVALPPADEVRRRMISSRGTAAVTSTFV